MPLSGAMADRSLRQAASPPADAPIAVTGGLAGALPALLPAEELTRWADKFSLHRPVKDGRIPDSNKSLVIHLK